MKCLFTFFPLGYNNVDEVDVMIAFLQINCTFKEGRAPLL